MSNRRGRARALVLAVAMAGCAPTSVQPETGASVGPSTIAGPSSSSTAAAAASEQAGAFPAATFADISQVPTSDDVAAKFQAALRTTAGRSGMVATVMSADGTWSGAVGKADSVRDMQTDDQFAIASITKPIVAAQVMEMVEAGELELDHPASDYLPADLDFDSNRATIRHLLSMRSGIPDYDEVIWNSEDGGLVGTRPRRRWTPAELLEAVPDPRIPADEVYQYSSTNYVLLGLIIEHVRGRPIAHVLRHGVLSTDGLDRLIYQPAERPTKPMAMPESKPTSALENGGGYLPSMAEASAGDAAAAMASDAPSLARWWTKFCAGEIVSEASLSEMATFQEGYGLGLSDDTENYGTSVVGHGGIHVGYAGRASCFVEDGFVIVVLTNRGDLGTEVTEALAAVAR